MSKLRKTILATSMGVMSFLGATQAAAETIAERLMKDLTADFTLKDFQAAAIVGNLARETGNFRYMQELNPLIKGSRGGMGYAQWTAGRRHAFEDYALSYGIEDLTGYEVNYSFLKHELETTHNRALRKVKSSANLEQATNRFMIFFLGPDPSHAGFEDRLSYAQAYLDGDFTGSGCQSRHRVYGDDRMIVVALCPEPYSEFALGEEVDPDVPMDLEIAQIIDEQVLTVPSIHLFDISQMPKEDADPVLIAKTVDFEGPMESDVASVLQDLLKGPALPEIEDVEDVFKPKLAFDEDLEQAPDTSG